jgi:hypothetical protein
LIAYAAGAVKTIGSVTLSVNCLVAVLPPAIAFTVNCDATAWVGVPTIAPFCVS